MLVVPDSDAKEPERYDYLINRDIPEEAWFSGFNDRKRKLEDDLCPQ
jgi:hypothetical protein